MKKKGGTAMARKKKAKVDEVQELDTAFTSMVGQKPAPTIR